MAAENLLLDTRLGDLLLGGKFKLFETFSLFSVPRAFGKQAAFNEL